jgi:hypothetical protein
MQHNQHYKVDDLLTRHKLIGMTRSQVEELLGKPDPIHDHPEYNYYLGRERGFISIDDECLGIKIEHDKVTKAGTWVD